MRFNVEMKLQFAILSFGFYENKSLTMKAIFPLKRKKNVSRDLERGIPTYTRYAIGW